MLQLVETDELRVFCLHRLQTQINPLLRPGTNERFQPKDVVKNTRLQSWFLESCKGQAPEQALSCAEFKERSFLCKETAAISAKGYTSPQSLCTTPDVTHKSPKPCTASLHDRSLLLQAYKTWQKSSVCYTAPSAGHKCSHLSKKANMIHNAQWIFTALNAVLAIPLLCYPWELLLFIHTLNTPTPQVSFHSSCPFDDFKGPRKTLNS